MSITLFSIYLGDALTRTQAALGLKGEAEAIANSGNLGQSALPQGPRGVIWTCLLEVDDTY